MLKNKKFMFLAAFLAFMLIFAAACGDDNGDDTGDDGDDVEEVEENGDDDNGDDEDDNGDDEADAGDGDAAAGGGVGVTGTADEIIIGTGGEIPSLDPHAQNMLAASQILYHTMETLVNQDVNLQIYPGIAESWEQLDDLRWQFNLRDDVYFHNGNKLTAEDVAFSLRRGADAPQVAAVIGMVDAEGIEVVDDYTVIIATDEPFAPFLNHMAHNSAAIMCSETVGDIGPEDSENEDIVGSGPYQVIENVSGDRLIMERWDEFHGELPNMRLITFRIIPDHSARTMALETGDVDAILTAQTTDHERLIADPNIELHSIMGLSMDYVVINTEFVPDARVRQAMNYALNTEEIVAITTDNTGIYTGAFVNSITFGHNPDFEGFPYDPDRARVLLQEAGYSGESGAGDIEIELFANTESPSRTQAVEIIQAQLREVGIDIEIQTMEFNAMNELLQERQLYMATLGWGTVTGDADYALFPLFHSNSHSPGTNHALLDNAELDELIELGRSSTDEAERIEAYWAAQEILREEAPWIILHNAEIRVFSQNNISGFTAMPHQGHLWGNVVFTD